MCSALLQRPEIKETGIWLGIKTFQPVIHNNGASHQGKLLSSRDSQRASKPLEHLSFPTPSARPDTQDPRLRRALCLF